MFGFSLTKLIFTVAIVYVVWKAFSHFTRMQDQRENKPRVKPRDNPGARPRAANPQEPQPGPSGPGAVEDMVECRVCGAYVAQGAQSCGKDNCPYTG